MRLKKKKEVPSFKEIKAVKMYMHPITQYQKHRKQNEQNQKGKR
jgi:hypothetical protein